MGVMDRFVGGNGGSEHDRADQAAIDRLTEQHTRSSTPPWQRAQPQHNNGRNYSDFPSSGSAIDTPQGGGCLRPVGMTIGVVATPTGIGAAVSADAIAQAVSNIMGQPVDAATVFLGGAALALAGICALASAALAGQGR